MTEKTLQEVNEALAQENADLLHLVLQQKRDIISVINGLATSTGRILLEKMENPDAKSQSNCIQMGVVMFAKSIADAQGKIAEADNLEAANQIAKRFSAVQDEVVGDKSKMRPPVKVFENMLTWLTS